MRIRARCRSRIRRSSSAARARRRSRARRGNGWYGFLRDLDATRADLDGLAAAKREADRPAALGSLEVTITPPPRIELDAALRYRDLGVDRLVLLPHAQSEASLLRWVDEAAERLVRKLC